MGTQKLDHLTGARFLASLWIVCGHFAPRLEETAFTVVRHRGNAAVNFFVLTSGFVTHWAYADRLTSCDAGELRRFFVRRMGRVVLTTWVAMLLGLSVLLVQLRGDMPDLGHVCAVSFSWKPGGILSTGVPMGRPGLWRLFFPVGFFIQ